MKRILTLIVCAIAFSAFSQGTTLYNYPYNPDSNGDKFIGVGDLNSFLSNFGSDFGLPPEPCDYDGTPLEDLVIGVTEGTIILDSIFIEYEIQDVSTYYILGCPDPVTDTVVYANSQMLNSPVSFQNSDQQWFMQDGGHEFIFQWNTANGTYRFRLNASISSFIEDGFFGWYSWAYTDWVPIPFPEDWSLDEDGIHLGTSSTWGSQGWPFYANYLHILPYWHHVED